MSYSREQTGEPARGLPGSTGEVEKQKKKKENEQS